MGVLDGKLRKLLEDTIEEARQVAESGARRALQSLAVERHEPHPSMSPDERRLRNRLRARGRQLGDRRDRIRGDQEIDRLTHEVAYEQWHRMLFARFLAENGVLVEPRSGVSITIEECEELARERGVDPHALAAQFAQEILPGVFRVGDPVLDVVLAPETRQALQRLLDELPS
ncbi:SAM-dependent methyltransferase, partial [Candidatus Poribacteria bacterium]|nr:SAM-dependent methyltransferase [Candidatus Poribacteria bacterium]